MITRFKPALYLHTYENYFPCSFETFIHYSSLFHYNTLIKLKDVNMNDLVDDRSVHFSLQTSFKNTIFEFDVQQTPIYAYQQRISDKEVRIVYMYFFAYNSGYFGVGAHVGDIEHVSVFLKQNDDSGEYEIQKMYYAAHGSKWGKWVDKQDIEFIGDHPVIYISKGSHASYHKPGIYWRVFGLANDCCDRGFLWTPQVIDVNNKSVMLYQGKWGTVRNFVASSWWKSEHIHSASFWKRMFAPCLLS